MSPRDLQHCRFLPYRWSYMVAIVLTVLHYLCLVALLSIMAAFAIRPHESLVVPIVVALVVCLGTWFVAFLRRRMVRCPLCKGTPLLDSKAATHVKARRLRPLNHGTTAVFGILFTQRFQCMYCGTPYDLLKPSSSRRRVEDAG